jgi:hypothetical protein
MQRSTKSSSKIGRIWRELCKGNLTHYIEKHLYSKIGKIKYNLVRTGLLTLLFLIFTFIYLIYAILGIPLFIVNLILPTAWRSKQRR